jgi:hypothetical protein
MNWLESITFIVGFASAMFFSFRFGREVGRRDEARETAERLRKRGMQ